jgi:DNA polymerase (family 10)
MLWSLTLKDLPGLGESRLAELNNGTYRGIPYKVSTISDIKDEDIDKLPRESMLALRYLDGKSFSREELAQFAHKYFSLFAPYKKCELVGSYRRGKSEMGDGDVLVLEPKNRILRESEDVKVINMGTHKARALFRLKGNGVDRSARINPHNTDKHHRWIPVDIVFTDKEHYPGALLHYTGSKEFNIHMTMHCAKLGIKLNEYGIWRNGKMIPVKSEKDIFKKAKLPYIPPEERHERPERMN